MTRRHWFQFRLKFLPLFITVLSVPLSWLGWKLEEKRRERWAVAKLRQFGCIAFSDGPTCAFDAEPPPGPAWLRSLFGDDLFLDIEFVTGPRYEALADEALKCLPHLPRLRALDLMRCEVNDAAIAHLHELRSLEVLNLTGTRVSTDGIAALKKALPQCRIFHDSQPKQQARSVASP